ncbi:ThiF family adenylyltransferase, partial [Sinomicrobium weinanense]
GSDNFPTRYLVNDAAVMCNRPVVFGSIYKFEGQVSVFNYRGGPTYRCLFPSPPPPGASPNCAEIGVLGVLPGLIGTMQANEVMKIICGLGEVLSGKLLTIDCLSMRTQVLKFRKTVHEIPEALNDTEYACIREEGVIVEVAPEDFIKSDLKNITVVDVRTSKERENSQMDILPPDHDDIHIPLDQLQSLHHTIPTHQAVVFYCQSGVRSQQAAQLFLQEYPSTNVQSLRGGLTALLNSVT